MNSSALPATMLELRKLLKNKFPDAHAQSAKEEVLWQTHLPCLDAAGLHKGAITEVVSEGKSCGTGLLITALLEAPTQIQQPVVLVDGCDAFDPTSVSTTARERLLWLRCGGITSATKATDLLLRDGNIPLILLDLQLHSSRQILSMPSSIWHRLRFLAEKSAATLCVFTPCRAVACARSRVILEHSFTLAESAQTRAELVRGLQVQVERCPRQATASNAQHMALAN